MKIMHVLLWKRKIMDSENYISDPNTPPSIIETANTVSNNILPDKSLQSYEFVCRKFVDWGNDKQINSFSENVLITYI